MFDAIYILQKHTKNGSASCPCLCSCSPAVHLPVHVCCNCFYMRFLCRTKQTEYKRVTMQACPCASVGGASCLFQSLRAQQRLVSMRDKCFKPLWLSVASQPAQAWATSLSGQVKQLDVRPLGLATQLNFQSSIISSRRPDWSACYCAYCHVYAIHVQVSRAHACLMK